MDDERRKRDELGSAPTTSAPQATLDVPAGDAVAPASDVTPGAAIGHFIVRKKLGEGGMGVVLACEDADLGRPVAVKLVRAGADRPAYRARLLREAQAMARLEHPNVVKVYEVGNDRGRLFIAMELVDGVTLSAWLRESRGWRDVVDMFLQIGDGLAAAHAAGLVHRDFKPDNVLVDRNERARVADFGLARLESADVPPLTKTGALMGTPGYMAPEQQFGADVDARADQYSYCVALREALGGRPLDDTRWNMVPKHIRAVVARGLSYDASERFASMHELLAQLRAVRGTVTEPRWIIALLVLVVLGTVSGIVVFFNNRKDERPQVATNQDAMPAIVEPEIADAGPDNRVVVEAPPPPPLDAGVDAAIARTLGTRRDAGVQRADAPLQAATSPPGLNVVVPTSKKLPEAQPGHPGHLPLVRTAIKNLGYDDFDASLTVDGLERTIDTSNGAAKAIAQVRLGQAKRKAGDCAVASAVWADSVKVLNVGSDDDRKWAARAWIGRSLCALATGKADDAFDFVARAWVHGNREEVQLLMGFIKFEQGEKDLAYGSLLVSERSKDAKVQAALKAWLDGMGFTLR